MNNLHKLSTVAVLCGALFTIAHADVTGKWRGTVNMEFDGGVKARGSTYTLDLNKSGRFTALIEASGSRSKPFTGTWSEKNGNVKLRFDKKSATMGLFDNPLKVQNDNLIGTIKMLYWSAKKPTKKNLETITTKAITFSRI